MNLVAGELQVGHHVRVARCKAGGLPIGDDRPADFSGFEPRVAEVEEHRGRGLAGINEFLVPGGGFGELTLFVEPVGRLEIRVLTPSRQRRTEKTDPCREQGPPEATGLRPEVAHGFTSSSRASRDSICGMRALSS